MVLFLPPTITSHVLILPSIEIAFGSCSLSKLGILGLIVKIGFNVA
jgi:hypothetical protein